ncbi:MAG: hypothetical protein ABIT71_19870 [Vicinamibacteraceae bacterium]
MTGLVRQSAVCAGLVVAAAAAWALAERSQPAVVEAGFWFERVAFASARLGGAITPADLATIEDVARGEMTHAFAGLPIRFSSRRDATYRVRVAQAVHDPRMRGRWGVAGASHAVPGLGGQGEVSFDFLAGGATAMAPEDATRDEIVAAIGRGIGRTAVHELTHQLLPQAPIHDSRDVRSYEYDSAARREQYFGEMHWDLARPLLQSHLSR